MKRLVKIIAVVLVGLTAVAYWLLADLPAVAGLDAVADIRPSVRIVDRYGRPLYDLIDGENGRNTILPLTAIPLALQQATIATEDKSFYDNPGLDAWGILRALWLNVRGGEIVAGGSTITQQVVRNLLLSDEERGQITVRRKLREAVLAWQVSQRYDKETVLALYLNQMYYGGMAYGVEAAAQTYFGKSARDLTLAESALIAGLPQSPALYNPLIYPEAAKERQTAVLDLLLKETYITPDEHELAVREPLFYAATPYPVHAPHFVMMVQSELDGLLTAEALYEGGGVTVRTTLDLDWQEHAESIVREQIERLNHPLDGGIGHYAHNAALVAMDPHSGEVMALVGNVDYFDEAHEGAINMALRPRQPGSALKPIVYAAGMDVERERPFTPATVFYDVRSVFITHEDDPYVPVNFSRDENGPVLLRQALGSSLNIPAVQALDTIEVETAMSLATEMGIGSLGEPDEYDLSFALGGGPVRLFDLARAYTVFANGGSRIQPLTILDVTDVAGNVLYEATPSAPQQVLDERVAWLISDILSDNEARLLSFGENSILQLDRTAAVKTGTTNDFHDNWTVGYTPDLVVGVWVGNANNQPMLGVTGVSGAAPIWHYFMRTVLNGTPDKPFPRPAGLVQTEVCDLSGLLPTAVCPFRRQEWFIQGTEPTQYDDVYQRVQLDKETGLLSTEATPAEQVVSQLTVSLPPVLQPWARAHELILLEDLLLASEQNRPYTTAPLRLISPDPNTTYRLSSAIPLTSQKLPIEAVTAAAVVEMTVWVDGTAVATLTAPLFQSWWPLEPGVHQMWVEAIDKNGSHLHSEQVEFEVLDVITSR
ncbi:MAG: transglycosylase domain-containing protein [Ardenticatenaceae bacterium]|nr:transglycosylase domain-containing protein [Ardenticatenaceae bacterium]